MQRLADRVEGNLLAAAQEIEKLALLSPDGVLDAARMDALVADAARFDVFRLVDAAMNGDAAQVSRMLAGLRAEGEVVPALLGMVVKELQRVAAIARVQARGGNLAAEFKAQQIWESRQAAYRRALPRHTAAQWEQFVARIAAIDQAAKGRAAGDPWILARTPAAGRRRFARAGAARIVNASNAAADRALHVFYGGTFDPVHNGHLAIACAARDALGVDIHLLPAADPPHRPPPGASASDRAEMVRLGIDGLPGLLLDLRELGARAAPGASTRCAHCARNWVRTLRSHGWSAPTVFATCRPGRTGERCST